MVCYLYRGRCPRLLRVVPSRHRSACGLFFLPRILRIGRIRVLWLNNRSKSLLLSPGLRPCSLMRMLSHVSELPCLTLHIRLVCPQADRKPTKQNSCPWQYKMSLHRRLLTVTLDLRGAYPQDASSVLPRICRMRRIHVLWLNNRSKSLLLSPGLRPCSLMRMLSQVSELPCLTLPIRLVCPQADRKASKQNSCLWQYKMSLRRRLRTVTSDL